MVLKNTNGIKKLKERILYGISAFLIFLSLITPFRFLVNEVHATGTDTFTLTASTAQYTTGQIVTITINESSTDGVNAVQANLSYDTAQLLFNSVTTAGAASSPFTICGQASGGSGLVQVGCAVANLTVTGTQPVAIASFTVLASSGSVSASILANSNSAIILASNQSNVWDGNSATTAIAAAAASGGGSTGGSTGGGSTGGGSTGGGSTGGGSTGGGSTGGGSTGGGSTSTSSSSNGSSSTQVASKVPDTGFEQLQSHPITAFIETGFVSVLFAITAYYIRKKIS